MKKKKLIKFITIFNNYCHVNRLKAKATGHFSCCTHDFLNVDSYIIISTISNRKHPAIQLTANGLELILKDICANYNLNIDKYPIIIEA